MSQLEYTEEQDKALKATVPSIAVDAGAGCGKTFVLTERFLSHLDPSREEVATVADLDHLVAITFTDAAAREMRGRIRARCRERLLTADAADAPFWRTLLRKLDTARVSTIHSFASTLIRNHAIELGVDPAFTVLDPAAAAVLKSSAVDATLRARLAPRDGELDEDLIATAAEFDLNGLRNHIRALAESSKTPEFAKWRKATADDLIASWRQFYVTEVAPRYAREFLTNPLVEELLDLTASATPVKEGFADWIIDVRTALQQIPDADDQDDAIRQLRPYLNFRNPATGKDLCGVKDWPDKASKQQFTALLKSLREVLDKQRRPGNPESMRRAAELGLQVLHLAHDTAKRYDRLKRDRGVLDNDDLLTEAHRLLTDPALADARGRIAGQVRVLLVDEFQDTDPLQAELVRAIVAGTPSDAAPLDGLEGERTLFFVGDFKQSIYRFRGAVPQVFQDLRAAAPEAGRLTLSKNFRSQPAVLDFVNTLFEPLFVAGYAKLSANRPQVGPAPAVEMLWTPPPEEQGVSAQRSAEAATVAARIRQLIDEGAPLVYDKAADAARPVRQGDFTILLRALSDVAEYEQALREAGLEYYLVGGHAFYAQQEVYDVLNLLRTLLSESDEIALAGVLRSPMFGLPDNALFWLAQRGGLNAGLAAGSLPPELSADEKRIARHARDTLVRLRREKDRVGAAELLRQAWDATSYDATLLADFLGERKLANLEKLHEQARQSDATGTGVRGLTARLTEFVNTPPKEALAATTEGDADVVRLMTVHASKGLEFPVVVLPDLNRRTRSESAQAVFDPRLGPLVRPAPRRDDDKEKGPPIGLDFWRATEKPLDEEERDRLFYVACTRAADRLILSSCYDGEIKLEGPWLKRLAERFDLTTGKLLDDEPAPPLVEVVPPPAAVAGRGETTRRQLHHALEAFDAGATPAAPVGDAAPIAILPEDLVTFSVSRLSGKLHRGASGETSEEPTAAKGVDPRRLGTLVHAVIERLDPAADSWESAIDRWSDALAPRELRRAAPEGAREAKRLVRRFIATPEWAAMRSAARLDRETEFLLRWPPEASAANPAMIRGYLDALYQDAAGGWHLVDYKTNSVDAKGVPALAKEYALQMAVYAHAIEAATGARPASLTLVFLAPGVSHAITWDDAARAASVGAISGAIADARQAATVTTL
ncbi:ATP-dependent helicase/nuclease subunit A [Botrimarina colliarenosi]|uniref:DNA 3'-5' helicase n=1 Tax=Botrimarina colliarenosi TaxID=2528001 RepID=A0A5C6A9H9_9BACT|nr:UvrD-helicase domain-containing protein [Botrimarina colliarenosi]TWT96007.1 ATP-dependent helicase/nuclease subunit A [Botrimarina colliarenosi]